MATKGCSNCDKNSFDVEEENFSVQKKSGERKGFKLEKVAVKASGFPSTTVRTDRLMHNFLSVFVNSKFMGPKAGVQQRFPLALVCNHDA